MALVVVATKLLFPFDEIKRHPATAKNLLLKLSIGPCGSELKLTSIAVRVPVGKLAKSRSFNSLIKTS